MAPKSKKHQRQDNSAIASKLQLRLSAVNHLKDDLKDLYVLETNCGKGKIYFQIYQPALTGIAIDKKADCCETACKVRPHWRTYNGENEMVLEAGAASLLPINLVDVDAYGNPWPTIDALLKHTEFSAPTIHLLVTDGNRRQLSYAGTRDERWKVGDLLEMSNEYGDSYLREEYRHCCEAHLGKKVESAGLEMSHFSSQYAGRSQNMTNYWAILHRH